jgi:hypothetical protein
LRRPPHSHKGQNGTVAIIGGSRFQHGAPLFSALAAEASGVDLIFVALPRCHAEVAKAQSLNMQVHPFTGDDIAACDLPMLLELLATMDCAVIGPGLARDPTAVGVIKRLIKGCPCPMVLDASALQPWTLDACAGKAVLCTPHAGELERMKIGDTKDNRKFGPEPFRLETETMRRLSHPAICKFFDSGTMDNAIWFIIWIGINHGFFMPFIPIFDPFPYGLLTMIVSLEAIFLSAFIMVAQNRQSLMDKYRDLEEEIDEHEEEKERMCKAFLGTYWQFRDDKFQEGFLKERTDISPPSRYRRDMNAGCDFCDGIN